MAKCLIALGSNLGDRAAHLRRAVAELARAPRTKIVRRSIWRETPPVGGPAGQGAFLNGAVLAETMLAPPALLAELLAIEARMGRVRVQRWEARKVDLDVLLYDRVTWQSAQLAIPHPRMHYRRFVLTGAADVAPWMIHPDSDWTVAQLLEQLDRGANEVAVAAIEPQVEHAIVTNLRERLAAAGVHDVQAAPWRANANGPRPKLILAVGPATGGDGGERRKMLHLPATGPIAWLECGAIDQTLRDAAAAMASVWPKLASIRN
jgi:2-amino-4-hydroxy-6-hydroxymethyldihydropteridine diphosphokinase